MVDSRKNPFVYTAMRKKDEIMDLYGDFKYSVVAPVKFSCKVTDDSQAMFRPAVYEISNCEPSNHLSQMENNLIPKTVVSMIGIHRNIARKNDCIKVSGVLERVEHLQTGQISFQVVVGSGTSENEYIYPFKLR
jgi:predicted nucleotidyltransferase